MSQEAPISSVSLVADFTGAELGGEIKPETFEFEVPKDVKLVDFLVPPHMGQLLNKKAPDFEIHRPGGQAGYARDLRRKNRGARFLVDS